MKTRTEMGVSPAPETRRLNAQMLHNQIDLTSRPVQRDPLFFSPKAADDSMGAIEEHALEELHRRSTALPRLWIRRQLAIGLLTLG